MNFSVSRVDWEQAAPLLKHIREKVFVCEWRIPKKVEFDQHDKHAFHMIVCDDETQEAVATGRIMLSGEISRIAVLKNYRQHQVDKVVLSGLVQIANELGLSKVYVNLPLQKVEHYLAHNFDIAGNVYMEAGIARQKMTCPLNDMPTAKYYLGH